MYTSSLNHLKERKASMQILVMTNVKYNLLKCISFTVIVRITLSMPKSTEKKLIQDNSKQINSMIKFNVALTYRHNHVILTYELKE